MTEHRGFWAAFGLACLSIGLGGYVSYSIGIAFSTRHVHLGRVPEICGGLISFGALVLIALLGVFAHLWWVKRFIRDATIEGIILYDRARILRLSKPPTEDVTQLTNDVHKWTSNTRDWLSTHDPSAYAQFAKESGLMTLQSANSSDWVSLSLCTLDVHLARLNDIAGRR